jgi:hypothetical protein
MPACESCGGVHLAKLLSVPAAHLSGEGGPRPMVGGGGGCGTGCGCHPH